MHTDEYLCLQKECLAIRQMNIVYVYCVVTIGNAKRYNFTLANETEEDTFSVQSVKYISIPSSSVERKKDIK